MSQTTYNYWVKPLSREQNLELFLASKLDEIDAALGNDYITGLQLVWVSNSQIQVATGAAWVTGYGRLRLPADTTLTVSIGANAWGHVYYFHNAGVPQIEVSTTGPNNYFATAHQKTGDAGKRYLGSIKTDASGNVINFLHDVQTNFIRYRVNVLSVLAAGAATSETAVQCGSGKADGGYTPTTSRRALIRFDNKATNAYAVIGNSDDSCAPPASGFTYINSAASPEADIPLSAVQTFTYAMSAAPSPSGLEAYVLGYYFRR